MGCGCKGSNETTKKSKINDGGEGNNESQGWVVKALLFLFVLTISPLILLFLLWVMFNSVINKKPINETMNFLIKRAESLKTIKEKNDEEEEELVEIDEVNYEYEVIGLDKQ